jgi:putative DNA primase/helicase
MAIDPFAPLPGRGRPPRTAAATKQDAWRVLAPVPDDAPPAPAKHYRHGKPARVETYRDGDGRLLGYVWRFELAAGGKEFAPLTYCEGKDGGRREWRWKAWGEPRPLYGLARLAQRPQAPVLVVEGEKAADAAAELLPDYVTVTSPNGSQSARKADWAKLAGRAVVIWPDADEAGGKYAETVAGLLAGSAASTKRLTPPSTVKPGWDAADALAEGWDQARTAAFVATAADQPAERQRRPRQSESLLDLIGVAELWHSSDREAFASIPINGHLEHWAVRSKSFKLWALRRYFEQTGAAPGGQAVEDALRVIEARAIFEGAEHVPFLRIAEHRRDLYLDLADEQWRAVRIRGEPQGWEIVDRAPVKFLRSNAMQPLPVPEPGAMIEQELRDLMNVDTEGDFKLAIAWLVGTFHPRGPYPILALNGEQGSSKSTLSRLLRCLIDPNTAPIRSAPRDEQTLIIAAKNSWIAAFDNLSDVQDWFSDALCRLATGGGFSTRELFTDYGEIVVHVTRPVMLNGIPDLASRADLADRAIHLTLPALDEDARRSEEEFWADVETRRPLILGALLDAVAGALHHRGEIPPLLTRMADFTAWVSGAELALGWDKGDFLKAYTRNRQGAVDTTIEADPIGPALQALVAERDWQGTSTRLLAELAAHVPDPGVLKSRSWPSAIKLRGRLRRLGPPLRTKGIVLDLNFRSTDAKRERLIVVRRADRGGDVPPD